MTENWIKKNYSADVVTILNIVLFDKIQLTHQSMGQGKMSSLVFLEDLDLTKGQVHLHQSLVSFSNPVLYDETHWLA